MIKVRATRFITHNFNPHQQRRRKRRALVLVSDRGLGNIEWKLSRSYATSNYLLAINYLWSSLSTVKLSFCAKYIYVGLLPRRIWSNPYLRYLVNNKLDIRIFILDSSSTTTLQKSLTNKWIKVNNLSIIIDKHYNECILYTGERKMVRFIIIFHILKILKKV